MLSSFKIPGLNARKIRFVVQFVMWTSAIIVLLVYTDRIHPDGVSEYESEEEAIRRELKDVDDRDSGYPFRDAFISYPYRKSDNKWAIVFHIIGIGYMMLGLNIVCDAYFCEALTCMCAAWDIQEDVAGATFMAAGGSAPEFFTSLMGVFVAKSDVGFGTIVGSAVFNVLFVIGLCAACSSVPLKLTWWPLFRDCSYYSFGLIVLSIFVWDEKVEAYEAAILFIMYLGYITVMWYNSVLERKVKKWLKTPARRTSSITPSKETQLAPIPADKPLDLPALETGEEMKDQGGDQQEVAQVKEVLEVIRRYSASFEEGGIDLSGLQVEEEDGEQKENPIREIFGDKDMSEKVVLFFSLPISFPLWLTVPDCTTDKWKEHFVLTFSISILWIAIFSYFLVWWASIVGDIMGIPTVVMGLTVLAAGTSIPDAISSVVMARLGQGDMAVSSSIGSNVFDILVGLPVPWLLKTAVVCPISRGNMCNVEVLSPYLVFNVIVLLCMVMAVVASIHFSGWVLTKHLGIVMAVLYAFFLTFAITIEVVKP